ncbi:hypothetical protein LTR78_004367 [Recurvomyces mirabilis]|uniref:Uncharacterized protein n=1 Tax=Recurvomyces mirabilis TaxID=574656 RepID=A0AAE0WPR9_9PEZI|nr:hypothetical protein LTR78_004367 [Recurvomyces mirabilis]KAK5155967.1 hypothetical protein LTS14_005533 [Recurvomyces mirabilis]
MTPRPSSPTSLLWAHQIKRENGHILERIRKLEHDNVQQDQRLKGAEQAAMSQASEDIAKITEQVSAIDPVAIKQQLSDIENDVATRLEDVQAESEATMLKMASLEQDEMLTEQARRKAADRETALLKRVAEVEAGLQRYRSSLDQVGRRIDEHSISKIADQLAGLTKQVTKEGSQMKLLEESIAALETANIELVKANDGLAEQIKELSFLPISVVATARPVTGSKKREVAETDANAEDGSTAAHPPRKRRKKSHKWSGGGADKDIIDQAAAMIIKPPARPLVSPRTTLGQPAVKPSAKAVRKPQLVRNSEQPTSFSKRAAPTPKPEPPPRKKPGPKPKPKTAIAPVIAPPIAPKKPVAGKATSKPAASPERFFEGQADKPILRAGKGWVEYAVTPEQSERESQEFSQIVDITSGRPRRSLPAQRDSMAGPAPQKPDRSVRKSAGAAIKQETTVSDDTGILTSPGATTAPVSLLPQQPARRRVIPQKDDGSLLQQFSACFLP